MNAYGSQSEIGLSNSGRKGRYGSPSRQIQREWTKGSGDKKKDTSQNVYLIPIAVVETLVMLGLIAMNYCFRFDSSARDSSSLADYKNLDLQPADVRPWRPYYNYSEDHEDNQNSTSLSVSFGITFGMPEYAFFVTAFVFPFLVILSVELAKSFLSSKPRKVVDSLGIMIPSPARRILRFYFVYLVFGSMAGMLTSFIKLLVPQPRPHFLAVCTDEPSNLVGTIRVEDCTNLKEDEVWEALRSFPSYHATIAVYGGAFVCLYIYYTMKFRGYYTVNVMLSLPVFVMAAIGALHRWATYHNTFRDIVWGGFIGLLLALHAVYGMLNKFKERPSPVLPVTAAALTSLTSPATPTPEPFSLRSPTPPPQVHHNPAFVDDEPIGNHFVRRPAPLAKQDQPAPPPAEATFPRYDNTPAPAPAPATMLPRVTQPPLVGAPAGRPTQAFNTSFGLDSDYRQQPDAQGRRINTYNQPRQRFSVAPPPDHEPVMPRPASAYPGPRSHHPPPPPRPRSRYEGASYF